MIEAVVLTAVAAGILLSLACLVIAYMDCRRSQRLVDAVSALAETREKRRRERVSECAGSPPSPPSPEKEGERE